MKEIDRAGSSIALSPSVKTIQLHVDAHSAQRMAADDARQRGAAIVFILRSGAKFWIGPRGGRTGCIRCFQLWRSTEASAGLEAEVSDTDDLSAFLLIHQAAALETVLAELHRSDIAPEGAALMRLVDLATGASIDEILPQHPDCEDCRKIGPPKDLTAARRSAPPKSAAWRSLALRDIKRTIVPIASASTCGIVRRAADRTGQLMRIATAELGAYRVSERGQKGYGRGHSEDDRRSIAALEAIERYAAMRPHGDVEVVRGTYLELKDHALDPRDFILPSPTADDQRHEISVFSEHAEHDWIWASSYRTKRKRLVPLQIAYYGSSRESDAGSPVFVQESSNGCAVGGSLLEATFYGLLEALERDAFLAFWYSRLPATSITMDEVSDEFAHGAIARLKAEGLRAEFFDLSVGTGAFVIGVRVVDPLGRLGRAVTFSAAAHVNPSQALESALAEVLTSMHSASPELREERVRNGRRLRANPAAVETLYDHVDQGWPPESIDDLRFEVAGASRRWSEILASNIAEGPDIRGAMRSLAAATLQYARDILVVNQSITPFREHGLKAVKVLTPGLLPMTFGHHSRRISFDRLEALARRLLVPLESPSERPHPFG